MWLGLGLGLGLGFGFRDGVRVRVRVGDLVGGDGRVAVVRGEEDAWLRVGVGVSVRLGLGLGLYAERRTLLPSRWVSPALSLTHP